MTRLPAALAGPVTGVLGESAPGRLRLRPDRRSDGVVHRQPTS